MPPKAPRPVLADRNAGFQSGTEYRLDTRSKSNAQESAVDLADVRFQRAVARLHRLGPRPLFEMLAELGAQFILRTEIERAVSRYAVTNPELIEAVGGRHFAPIPLHRVKAAP